MSTTTSQFGKCTTSIFNNASRIINLEKDKKDAISLEQQQWLYAALVADVQVLQDLCINLGKVVANTSHSRSQ